MNFTQHLKNISQGLTSIPTSRLLAGNLALSNLADTLVFDPVLYSSATDKVVDLGTGFEAKELAYDANRSYETNDIFFIRSTFKLWKVLTNQTGGSHDTIEEGVNFTEIADGEVQSYKTVSLEFKSRDEGSTSYTGHNITVDGLRGFNNPLISNDTYKESDVDGDGTPNDYGSLASGTGQIIKAVSGSTITLGNLPQVNITTEVDDYVVHVKAYHKVMITTTKHGKRQLEAFDDVSNRSMILYEGSGITGHKLLHSLGNKPDTHTIKGLETTSDWTVEQASNLGGYMKLNDDLAYIATSSLTQTVTNTEITLGSHASQNTLDDLYIVYLEASSSNMKIGTYFGTTTDIIDNLFVLSSTDADTNADGIEYFYRAYLDADGKISKLEVKAISAIGNWVEIDYARGIDKRLLANTSGAETTATTLQSIGTSGSQANLPTDTTFFKITDGQMMFSNGYVDGKALNTKEVFIGANNIIPTNGWSQGTNYAYRNENTDWKSTLDKPLIGENHIRDIAGYNPDMLIDGKWYSSTNGDEKVTNGDFATDTNWTKGTGWTIANGAATSDGSQTADSLLTTSTIPATVADTIYTIKFTVMSRSAGNIALKFDGIEVIADQIVPDTYEVDVIASDTTGIIDVVADLDFVGSVTDVTLFEKNIEPDTAYTTPRTYLDGSLEVDGAGEPVEYDPEGLVVPEIAIKTLVVGGIVWKGKPYIDPYNNGANPEAIVDNFGVVRGTNEKGWYYRYPNGDIDFVILFDFTGSILTATVESEVVNLPVILANTNGVISASGDSRNVANYVYRTDILSTSSFSLSIRNDSGATRTYGYSKAFGKGRWYE